MEGQLVPIDDQPMAAGLFGEGHWLTEFITPGNLEVKALFDEITDGIQSPWERIIACWQWVTEKVQYIRFVKAHLWVNGQHSVQGDYWAQPSLTVRVLKGNCATQSFLLSSLLRNILPPEEIFCVLGNLYNGRPGGHSWTEIEWAGKEYILEATTQAPLVEKHLADRYETVHAFNDQMVLAVPGRTVLVPFSACYSTWLKDYLNWSYIEGGR